MSLVLSVLAALASPPDPCPAASQEARPISYRVRVIEMDGLRWRSSLEGRLLRVDRPGPASVWTADREALPELARTAARVVEAPQVSARPEATARVVHSANHPYVRNVRTIVGEHPAGASKMGARPEYGEARDDLRIEVSGRKLDQGVLTLVAVDDTWVPAIHAADATSEGIQVQVPEVVRGQVEGEWLIPADGVLVVSLGAHTVADKQGRALVRERLIVVEAAPADRPASVALAPATMTDAPAPFTLPPLPDERPSDPETTRTCRALTEVPVEPDPSPTTPLVLSSSKPGPDGAQPTPGLPTPALPGRSLPLAFAPDGSPAPPQARHDEGAAPASADTSDEPRPSPQAMVRRDPAACSTACSTGFTEEDDIALWYLGDPESEGARPASNICEARADRACCEGMDRSSSDCEPPAATPKALDFNIPFGETTVRVRVSTTRDCGAPRAIAEPSK